MSDRNQIESGDERQPCPVRQSLLMPVVLAAGPPAKKGRARKGKAPKKEKRTNAAGNTVRWAEKPSIKCQDRIQRALPGQFLAFTGQLAVHPTPGAWLNMHSPTQTMYE